MFDEQPLVSVIVTTYNRQELLKETLESILSQTYTNFELIVVDNFSNYDFFQFLKSFNDVRIRAFQNQNNGIIAVNRNYGIKNAKGKYIAFCDDDDLWTPDKIEKQLSFFNNNIIGVGSNAIAFGDIKLKTKTKIKENVELVFSQIFYQSVPLSSLIIRNTGILFDENPIFKTVEDADLQLQILCNNQNSILMLSEPLIYYRVHNLNQSTAVHNKLNFLNVLEKYKPFMSSSAYSSKYAHFHYCLGFTAIKQENKDARKHLNIALKTKQIKRKALTIMLIILSFLPHYLNSKLIHIYYQFKQK